MFSLFEDSDYPDAHVERSKSARFPQKGKLNVGCTYEVLVLGTVTTFSFWLHWRNLTGSCVLVLVLIMGV